MTSSQVAVFLAGAYELAEGPDPGFVDVPVGVWYADHVARLAASGITPGCGGSRFCPRDAVTRAQMATLLYRAQNVRVPPPTLSPVLVGGFGDVPADAYYTQPVVTLSGRGVFARTACAAQSFCPEAPMDRKTLAVWMVRVLDGGDPSPVSESRFSDVNPSGFRAPFIERLAELEITSGCGDGVFCPNDTVTRAQVAVFLAGAYPLPEGPDPEFADVPAGAWYADQVARLKASGITAGCGDGSRFCPGDTVTGPRWRHSSTEPKPAPPHPDF
ncbi:MAG: S-layer homology domain-containing protein [bacterium]|nr:S-layer homology domain-containing protein [bacterium]